MLTRFTLARYPVAAVVPLFGVLIYLLGMDIELRGVTEWVEVESTQSNAAPSQVNYVAVHHLGRHLRSACGMAKSVAMLSPSRRFILIPVKGFMR